MNEEYLNLLESIRDTLEEIKNLRDELDGMLDVSALEHLEKVRDALEEIQRLREGVE